MLLKRGKQNKLTDKLCTNKRLEKGRAIAVFADIDREGVSVSELDTSF